MIGNHYTIVNCRCLFFDSKKTKFFVFVTFESSFAASLWHVLFMQTCHIFICFLAITLAFLLQPFLFLPLVLAFKWINSVVHPTFLYQISWLFFFLLLQCFLNFYLFYSTFSSPPTHTNKRKSNEWRTNLTFSIAIQIQ